MRTRKAIFGFSSSSRASSPCPSYDRTKGRRTQLPLKLHPEFASSVNICFSSFGGRPCTTEYVPSDEERGVPGAEPGNDGEAKCFQDPGDTDIIRVIRNIPPSAAFASMDEDEFARLSEPIALVVDDEPLILMDTVDMIADEAFEFLTRCSSLQLLFTDVQLPDILTASI
jgi:hypothetical protein